MKYKQTYLPLFKGFYGSIWDDPELYGESEHFGLPEDEIHGLIDWQEYHKTLAEDITDRICNELESMGFIKGYEFEKLISPQYYNFSNDSINIKCIPNYEKIKRYIYSNMDVWIDYIKIRYQPRSGFIPYYTNDALSDEWELKECMEDSHKLGTLLEFILENEGIDEHDLTYDIESSYIFPYKEGMEPEPLDI